ncbi:MAG: substrate-binding domain-containing protein [Anaerolineae bacterium]|nr:substrate-binding domain-containing protein [Anaerolineae bacterium]
MQIKKFLFLTVLAALALTSLAPAAVAAPPLQSAVACEQEVIVQADDWLSRIAEKVYGDVLAYPAIAEATNAKNAEDSSFAKIDNVDVIETGWKLCVPSPADAEALLAYSLTAPDVTVSPAEPTGQQVGRLVLATTTSTQDSGLLDVILPDFETRYAAEVEVIAVGTGQAIELGRNCDADVVLVHARSQEDAFVNDGAGINRQDVMYNDFVILGPAADPAGIKGMTDAGAAFLKIAETRSSFVSRGDNSGTHTKEQSVWEATGLTLIEAADVDPTKPYKRPEGDWYQSVGQGMGAVLTIANEQQAYTLSDRATYLARQLKGTDLEILVEGDSRLFNPYGVIEVNPEKCPTVNAAGAHTFVEWMTSLETQILISQFGVDKFGQSLFVPDSEAWNAAKPQ